MASTLQEAVGAFYAAGNLMFTGDISGMEAIWSAADDISDMGPTGAIRRGRQAVMEQFAKESAMGIAGTVVAVDPHIVETPELGYLVCREQGATAPVDGQTIQVDLRSTTIFRREAGHWRVVHHHTDRF